MDDTNHTAPIVAVFTHSDVEAIRQAMARHPSVLAKQLAPVIDIKTGKEI